MTIRYGAYTDVSPAAADLEARLLTRQWDVGLLSVKNPAYAGGAIGDGLTNDRAALVAAAGAASTTAAIVFPPGTYLVSSNLTLTCAIVLEPGAMLKPAAGVTITITGAADFPLRKVFDLSAGGLIALAGNVVEAFHPQWWGVKGDGVTDDTAAWQATGAAASAAVGASSQMGVRIATGDGAFVVTDTITISANRVHVEGAGKYATTFLFSPAGPKVLFKFQRADTTQIISQISLGGFGAVGGGTAQKILVDAYDFSEFRLHDIVTNNWTGNSGNTATPSIGLRTNGREFLYGERVTLYADRPIHVRINPNLPRAGDHFDFDGFYLGALVDAEDCVVIDAPGIVDNLTFRGKGSMVGGRHGINWTCTARCVAANLADIRREQTAVASRATGYALNITGGGLADLLVSNCATDSGANGFRLALGTGTDGRCTMIHCRHEGGAGTTGLDISCTSFEQVDTFFQAGCTVDLHSLIETLATYTNPRSVEVAVPMTASYHTMPGQAGRRLRLWGQGVLTYTGTLVTGASKAFDIDGVMSVAYCMVSFYKDADTTSTLGGAGSFVLKNNDYSGVTPPNAACGVEAVGVTANCQAANDAITPITAGKAGVSWDARSAFSFINRTGVTVRYTITLFFQ